jgi:hypothetical protein
VSPMLIAQAVVVSEEEAKLIEAFRQFKANMLATEATFQWKTKAADGVAETASQGKADTPEKASLRKLLREKGEPCCAPRDQCKDDYHHMLYYYLSDDQKDLMMREREQYMREHRTPTCTK